MSIQSQILIDEPYYNEPGYETHIGKSRGIENSKSYNDNIRKYNLDHAINGLIECVLNSRSDYVEFNDIIRNYFKFKKNDILNMLNKWEDQYNNNTLKNAFGVSKQKFIDLVNRL